MAERKQHLPLIAAAGALLAVASGCVTADANKPAAARKPDVTQPGVLPPPQEMVRPAGATAPGGVVVPAGGAPQPAPIAPGIAVTPPAAPPGPSAFAKLAGRVEKKVPATEMQVAWRNRIAYLPDPSRNGAMGAGLAGQMFLYGGPNLEFAQADGVLTVDLIDETPRPAGQPAALPERWQFDKNTLRNLKTYDETFGKSYVLFLPWPAYKPDVTKVRISARYDPESGHTLYAAPSVVTIDTSAPLGSPVWDGVTSSTPIGPGAARPQPLGAAPTQPPPAVPPSALLPAPLPIGGGPVSSIAPNGAPVAPDGLLPIALTVGGK